MSLFLKTAVTRVQGLLPEHKPIVDVGCAFELTDSQNKQIQGCLRAITSGTVVGTEWKWSGTDTHRIGFEIEPEWQISEPQVIAILKQLLRTNGLPRLRSIQFIIGAECTSRYAIALNFDV